MLLLLYSLSFCDIGIPISVMDYFPQYIIRPQKILHFVQCGKDILFCLACGYEINKSFCFYNFAALLVHCDIRHLDFLKSKSVEKILPSSQYFMKKKLFSILYFIYKQLKPLTLKCQATFRKVGTMSIYWHLKG